MEIALLLSSRKSLDKKLGSLELFTKRSDQSFSGVGRRKTMMEKLLLAVTITFSLNLFLQVHVPEQTNTDGNNYQQEAEISPNLLVTVPKK